MQQLSAILLTTLTIKLYTQTVNAQVFTIQTAFL